MASGKGRGLVSCVQGLHPDPGAGDPAGVGRAGGGAAVRAGALPGGAPRAAGGFLGLPAGEWALHQVLFQFVLIVRIVSLIAGASGPYTKFFSRLLPSSVKYH